MGKRKSKSANSQPARVSLKTLCGLSEADPTTVSVVLNEVPGRSIPKTTRERIRKAAINSTTSPASLPLLKKSPHHDRRHPGARIGNGYHAEVMTGIGDRLLQENYFYFIAHHRHRQI